jgi:hypothetical protein
MCVCVCVCVCVYVGGHRRHAHAGISIQHIRITLLRLCLPAVRMQCVCARALGRLHSRGTASVPSCACLRTGPPLCGRSVSTCAPDVRACANTALRCRARRARVYEGTRVRERWSDLQATTATRPIAVTGFGDDTDDEEEDGNSLGAKRVLARLGVAMARSNRSRRSPHAHCTPASSACVHLHTQRC